MEKRAMAVWFTVWPWTSAVLVVLARASSAASRVGLESEAVVMTAGAPAADEDAFWRGAIAGGAKASEMATHWMRTARWMANWRRVEGEG